MRDLISWCVLYITKHRNNDTLERADKIEKKIEKHILTNRESHI